MEYICDYYGINLEWIVADPTGIWGMLQSGEADTIACVTTVKRGSVWALTGSPTPTPGSLYCIVSRTEDGVPEAGDQASGMARPSVPPPVPTPL